MKKIESKYSVGSNKELTPFEMMKMSLRNNLKGLKKEEEKENESAQAQGPYRKI